jgi:hypothetical protein
MGMEVLMELELELELEGMEGEMGVRRGMVGDVFTA